MTPRPVQLETIAVQRTLPTLVVSFQLMGRFFPSGARALTGAGDTGVVPVMPQTRPDMRRATLLNRKERVYLMMYEFTFDSCGACVESGCACKDRICQHVEEQAAKSGHRFEKQNHPIRFIGPKGCVVPPHLRETCTLYLCGKAREKSSFDRERYARLLRVCEKIEWQLMEIEDTLVAR